MRWVPYFAISDNLSVFTFRKVLCVLAVKYRIYLDTETLKNINNVKVFEILHMTK